METSFQAGFAIAQALSYLAATLYFVWASRRPSPERGIAMMGGLFALLLAMALSDAALASASLQTSSLVGGLNGALHILAPLALLAAGRAARSRPGPAPYLAYTVGLGGAAFALSASLANDLPLGIHATGTSLTQSWRLFAALGGLAATWSLGQGVLQGKGLGPLPFFGACGLMITLGHDALRGDRVLLSGLGYAGFTLALIADRVAEFTRRRDKLQSRATDLSKRSEQLEKAFRELRAAQAAIVRKEQLAVIGELSAVVAHEVRNPLAVITNAVATLRRPETTVENRDVLLEILAEETARLNALVGDLLHYAKPLSPEVAPVKPRELVDRALAVAEGRANVIVVVKDHFKRGSIAADPHLLRQALDNLVHNALQAMAEGGTLTVEIRKEHGDRPGLELVVRDTGGGMDTQVRKRALDPFFTTRPAGTGLGLAIVARVVDAHAGRLRIFSEPELGTEVVVFLPDEIDTGPSSSRARLLPPAIEPFPDPAEPALADQRSSA